MKKFLEMLTEEMQQAFTAAGYDGSLGKVMLSNRPDLCEYQCNGAMAGAKLYKKAPIMIANDVAEQLKDSKVFSEVVAVAPGFLNLKVSEAFLLTYLQGMEANEKFGLAGEARTSQEDHYRLRRPQRGKTSACGTFTFRSDR